MENHNSDKVSKIQEKAQRLPMQGSVAALTKEKLIIAVAMFVFAIVLLSVVLVVTFTGDKGNGNLDENGPSSGHKHNYELALGFANGKFNIGGQCKADGCKDPFYLESDVQGVTLASETAATCVSEGKKVYTLARDGKEYSYTETLPKIEHVYEVALCLEEGKFNLVGECKNTECKKIEVFEADVQGVTIASETAATCVSEGKKVYTLARDGKEYSYTETLPKIEHVYEVALCLEEGKFNLVGECTNTECKKIELIEADVQGVTLASEIAVTCVSDGKKVYTLTKDGKEYSLEEVIKSIGHNIGGVSIDEFRDDEGYLVYDGKNILTFGAVEISCGKKLSSEEGCYMCTSCEKVCFDSVVIPHMSSDVWVPKEGNVANCTEDGFEVDYCKFCSIVVIEERAVEAFGHSYKETLEYNKEYAKIFFVSDCERDGCDELIKLDVTSEATESDYKPATCESVEKTTYSYKKDGTTYTCEKLGTTKLEHTYSSEGKNEDGSYSYKVGVTVLLDANVNLVCGATLENGFYLLCTACGGAPEPVVVVVPAHNYTFVEITKNPSFEEEGAATLDCNNPWCNEGNITVELDKLVVGENAVEIEAANDVYCGKYQYSLTTAQGVLVECDVTIAHDHSNEFKYDAEEDKFVFESVCQRSECGKVSVADVTDVVTETDRKPATCQSAEEITYSYEKDGETYTCVKLGEDKLGHAYSDEGKNADGSYNYKEGVTIPLDANVNLVCGATLENGFYLLCTACGEARQTVTVKVPAHHYVLVEVTKRPNFEEEGAATLDCDNPWCNEGVVTVKLDKAVVGVNAEEIEAANNTHGGKYRYTTTITKYNVEVEIEITITHVYVDTLEVDENNKVWLVSTCNKSECPDVIKVEITNDSKLTVNEKAATCQSVSETVYTYKDNGKELSITKRGDQMANHQYNTGDKILDAVMDAEEFKKTFAYRPGYTIPMGGSDFVCGESSSFFFLLCMHCNGAQTFITVNIPAHDYELVAIVTIPTFETDGAAIIKCKNTWCAEKNISVKLDKMALGRNATLIEAANSAHHGKYSYRTEVNGLVISTTVTISHNFKDTLEVDSSNVVWLVSTCQDITCKQSNKKNITNDSRLSKEEIAATCQSVAKTKYSFVNDGDVLTCTKDTGTVKAKHKYNTGDKILEAGSLELQTVLPYREGYMILFDSSFDICCGAGNVSNSTFILICESCKGAPIGVAVSIPDHDYVIEVRTNPTLSSGGEVVITCKNGWCKDKSLSVKIDKMILGEGGNTELVEASNSTHNGIYLYKTKTPQGIEVQIEIKFPK